MKKVVALLLCAFLLICGVSCSSSTTESRDTELSDYEKYLQSEIDRINNGFGVTYLDETEQKAEVKDEQSYTVYVSKYGKIHKRSNCSGMKYYTAMSYKAAMRAGYALCQNCY